MCAIQRDNEIIFLKYIYNRIGSYYRCPAEHLIWDEILLEETTLLSLFKGFTDYAKAFVWITTNWKILKDDGDIRPP